MVVCRNVNAGVVVPLVLAFGIGVLVYLYTTSRSQYNILLEDMKELQKDLANARSEKESLQYELNTNKDELERVLKAKGEALERVERAEVKANEADEEMNKLRTDIQSLHAALDKAKEDNAEIQDNRDKAKGDITTYMNKWKLCESVKSDADRKAKLKTFDLDQQVTILREEVETLRREKTDAERRFNDMEHSFMVCESLRQSSHQHQRVGAGGEHVQQHNKQHPVAVDDRSMELLPPRGVEAGKVKEPSNNRVMGKLESQQQHAQHPNPNHPLPDRDRASQNLNV